MTSKKVHKTTVYKGDGKSWYGSCSCGKKSGACKLRKFAEGWAANHRLATGAVGRIR